MILEEVTGDVVVTVMKENGATVVVAVGDYISDHESSTICVTGVGKATVRVDPSCTFDIKGVVAEVAEQAPVTKTMPKPAPAPAPTPAPVEAAPVAEVVAPTVEATSEVAEAPTKK